ncbi:MAG: pyridoxamine 5'-phosphate oxidase family protein [Weeksellaceae bacterium]|nr:pyridoxamine 5'-phosphate oxidase family protein [Weeksellaceae bacterium]
MSTKNYYDKKAQEKLKDMAEGARVCFMCTKLSQSPLSARPMSLQEVDDDGILWFISGKDSDKNYHLQKDAETQLFFLDKGNSEYLSIFGKADIYTDRATIEDKWSKMAEAWFEEGKDDPNVSIIGVRPQEVHYWENKSGGIAGFAMMAFDAVTGSDLAKKDSEHGELNV